MIDAKNLQNNLAAVQDRIKAAALRVGRDPNEIKLVVVTKGRSIEEIQALFGLGIRDFGENRLEEGKNKIEFFSELEEIQWHMIGHVQSRKAKNICAVFAYLHALDSKKLASRVDRFAKEENRSLPVLLQFNVSGEESKFGWTVENELDLKGICTELEFFQGFDNLQIQGLMTMAPYDPNAENSRPFFRRLSKFRDHLQEKYPEMSFNELSMGMSGDFEVAVEEGATILRVGSAIFDY